MTKKYSRFPDQERPDGGWLYGQLTEAEVEFFCKLAKGRSVPLVLTGSLAETDLGLRRRYTELLQGFLAKFHPQGSTLRRRKAKVRHDRYGNERPSASLLLCGTHGVSSGRS